MTPRQRRSSSMARLRETFLSFLPRTWVVPGDAEVLAAEMAAYSRQLHQYTGRKVTYIVKPDGGAKGDGIFLVTKYEEIECVVRLLLIAFFNIALLPP